MAVADKIAELEAILDAGVSRTSTDGLSVQFDLDEIRRRLVALRDQADGTQRPRIAQINLSNF